MKRKAWKYGAVGFLLGCFAYLLFAVARSLRMGTGEFCSALPVLTEGYSSELSAVTAQIAGFACFGAACGIAWLIGRSVQLTPGRQAAGYLGTLTAGILPLAWAGRWFEHVFYGLVNYLMTIAAVSLLLFVVELLNLRRDVGQIRQEIQNRKELPREKI